MSKTYSDYLKICVNEDIVPAWDVDELINGIVEYVRVGGSLPDMKLRYALGPYDRNPRDVTKLKDDVIGRLLPRLKLCGIVDQSVVNLDVFFTPRVLDIHISEPGDYAGKIKISNRNKKVK